MVRTILALLTLFTSACAQREAQLLWPHGAPGALGTGDADRPSITVHRAARPNGTAVVVCPGGSYQALAIGKEGSSPTEWLNSRGISAFVLKYRLGPRYHHPIPLNDLQRAIRVVRANAAGFGIAPGRVGVWGFSAGGHLASTAATHFDRGNAASPDPIERQGCRPDFAILAYPVITMAAPYAHERSRTNLLGNSPDPRLVELLSNEKQVTRETPPAFLFHTSDDETVPVENSVMFYLALRKFGIPAEMHIYEHGAHGVGLAPRDPVLASWLGRLDDWLKVRGLLTK